MSNLTCSAGHALDLAQMAHQGDACGLDALIAARTTSIAKYPHAFCKN